MTNPVYALGHSERELARLQAQERLIGPVTRRFFRAAGIEAGMRVLDVGSGAGCKDWLEAATALLGSMLPAVERLGVATAAEIEIDTLAERMLREVTANGSLILGRSEIAAWSRVER